jgi:hypothetical protein
MESVTKKLVPDVFDSINWGNIWKRKPEDGTGFQFMVLCSILSVAYRYELNVEIPLLQTYTAGDYFLMRNELPLAHNAQAGNSATALHKKPLQERFIYSLIPKFIIEKDGNFFSFFIEGCPYHKIATGKKYDLRPDIIVFKGKPQAGFPSLNEEQTEIEFYFDTQLKIIGGGLRIINSPIIPCSFRTPSENIKLAPISVIECSVNKSKEIAEPQLEHYKQVFSDEENQPILHIVTGNELVTSLASTAFICLTDDSTSDDCLSAGKAILDSIFGA